MAVTLWFHSGIEDIVCFPTISDNLQVHGIPASGLPSYWHSKLNVIWVSGWYPNEVKNFGGDRPYFKTCERGRRGENSVHL